MNDTNNLPEAVEVALAELLHAQLLLGVATAKRRPTADAPEVLAASKALIAVCDAVRAALAQPAAPDRWNEGFKHGQWLAKHSAPVVERGAGNLSDSAAPVAHAEPASEPAPAPRLRGAEAPRRTEWGAGMMEALIALGVDETLRLYAHRDAVPMVDALLPAQPAPALVPLKDRLLAEAADTIEQMRETMRQVVLALHEAGHAPKHEQHVADAVRAALAAPAVPPQKPLHIEALNDAWEDRDRDYVRCFHSFAAGVSVAERAHGILLAAAPTAQQEPKP